MHARPTWRSSCGNVHDHLRRPLLLVCDRWSVHRAAVTSPATSGLRLARRWSGCPAYAPDLDPVENVWNQSKYGDLANFIPDDITQLHDTLDHMLQEYRHEPNRLHSFFHAAHLIP